jgi:hypothetical protein
MEMSVSGLRIAIWDRAMAAHPTASLLPFCITKCKTRVTLGEDLAARSWPAALSHKMRAKASTMLPSAIDAATDIMMLADGVCVEVAMFPDLPEQFLAL